MLQAVVQFDFWVLGVGMWVLGETRNHLGFSLAPMYFVR